MKRNKFLYVLRYKYLGFLDLMRSFLFHNFCKIWHQVLRLTVDSWHWCGLCLGCGWLEVHIDWEILDFLPWLTCRCFKNIPSLCYSMGNDCPPFTLCNVISRVWWSPLDLHPCAFNLYLLIVPLINPPYLWIP